MAEPFDTPVTLIIFNRPDYLRRVFAAIRAARPSRLYVIADGPRASRPDDATNCAAARAIIDTVDWPCEVRREFATENLGSGRRIASGLDWVFGQEPETIVLEDDFVPHPDFFRFCREMLERYRDDTRVATIGGANFLAHLREFPVEESYFFSRYYSIAGWATWRRSWKNFDFHLRAWPEFKRRGLLQEVYSDRFVRHYYDHAWEQCYGGKRPDIWDFQWMFACAANNGLCIVPRVNLTTHIGVIGTHSDQVHHNDLLPAQPLYAGSEPLHPPRYILANPDYDREFFTRNFHPASLQQPSAKLRRRVRTILDAVSGKSD